MKLIIVDDIAVNRKLLRVTLEAAGHSAVEAADGVEALETLACEEVDAVVSDVLMPRMDGYRLCYEIRTRERLCNLPIVIYTSTYTTPGDATLALNMGADRYLRKPAPIEAILAAISDAMAMQHSPPQPDVSHEVEALKEYSDRLVRKLEERNIELERQVKRLAEAQVETIFAMAKLAESRDDETGRHVERVQVFCRLLATALKENPNCRTAIDESWIENFSHASPLHDIGKVAIRDQILLKPGRLTFDEFEIMKTHAALGAEILRAVHDRYPDNEFIAMGIRVARWHHERWDGSGYPDGLAGDKIPLCARILAVADCYDAMRSRRCYKPPIPHDETCAFILEGAGKQFDPVVAAVFGEVAETIRDIAEANDADRCHGQTAGFAGSLAEGAGLLALSRAVMQTGSHATRLLVIEDKRAPIRLARLVLGGTERRFADIFTGIGADRPQTILLDLVGPDSEGLALARQLKADPGTCDIQVVAVTSHPEDFPRSAALSAGCDAYLVIPADKGAASGPVAANGRAREPAGAGERRK